jgi:tRNA threonylcarbamoyladenosine biosynthesis protein TsaB
MCNSATLPRPAPKPIRSDFAPHTAGATAPLLTVNGCLDPAAVRGYTGSMTPPALLAIDSSTECLCVSAGLGGRVATRVGPGGAEASARVLVEVRQVLTDIDVAMSSLAAVAFAQGPGAFTGLRTACSVAQGLAFGLGRPAIPLDSLLVVAEAARGASIGATVDWRDVAVVVDARMGEVYGARWSWHDDDWVNITPARLWRPADLALAWKERAPTVWVGSGLALLPPMPGQQLGPTSDHHRAEGLLRLALGAWQHGRAVPAHAALPVYVRDKVALTTTERQVATTVARA